jgi:hypothetical protein
MKSLGASSNYTAQLYSAIKHKQIPGYVSQMPSDQMLVHDKSWKILESIPLRDCQVQKGYLLVLMSDRQSSAQATASWSPSKAGQCVTSVDFSVGHGAFQMTCSGLFLIVQLPAEVLCFLPSPPHRDLMTLTCSPAPSHIIAWRDGGAFLTRGSPKGLLGSGRCPSFAQSMPT